ETEMRRWLFHATYHRAISALRRHRRIVWESLDDGWEQDTSLAVSFEDGVLESQEMQDILDQLLPMDVACLMLIAVYDFTAAEVSHIIGISPDAVAKRFSRAKQRLRVAYLAHQAAQSQERSRL